MTVWLLKDGENTPATPGSRKMRTWLLAEALQRAGANVTWWASTFAHYNKRLIFDEDTTIQLGSTFRVRHLFSGGYRKNFSLGRFQHHRRFGQRFRECAPKEAPPDLIVSAFPIIEMAYEAVVYGCQRRIPVIVDARDFWPDSYLDPLPRVLRPAARILLLTTFNKARRTFAAASHITAMSEGVLSWALRRARRGRRPGDAVFYLGYPDSPAFHSRLPKAPSEPITAVYVGAFGGTYRLDVVCKVITRLNREDPCGIRFILAGAGDQLPLVSQKLQNCQNVTLPGWLSKDDLEELLVKSDIGLLPWAGMRDAMPNKTFDYMGAGLALVSSLEGEMESLLDRHQIGMSYNARDPESLYRAIKALSEDRTLLNRLGSNAAALFQNSFRADLIYPRFANHILERLGGVRQPFELGEMRD